MKLNRQLFRILIFGAVKPYLNAKYNLIKKHYSRRIFLSSSFMSLLARQVKKDRNRRIENDYLANEHVMRKIKRFNKEKVLMNYESLAFNIS